MQKEKELALKNRASKAWEARAAADERAIKRARECLEASSFPRLARELSEFIGAGAHVDTREVAGHKKHRADIYAFRDEIVIGKAVEAFGTYGYDDGVIPSGRVKPYISTEINWDYERDMSYIYWKPGTKPENLELYKYKHIAIHFEEDWKIHVIGGTVLYTTTLSKNKWHGKQREQEKALEKAYLHWGVLKSYSIPSFMKRQV